MSAYQGKISSEAKVALAEKIAENLGWDTLTYDTWPTERKFNIWFFYDKTRGFREIETKPVKLKNPLPERNGSR